LCYAVNDTRFLEQLAGRLGEELSKRGRVDWHRQSCRAMVESTGRDSLRNPEEAWRIKGAGRLSRRQLAYLREIWSWRDQQARQADMPAFKILGNEQLVEVLLWSESHQGLPLSDGPKLPRNIHGLRLRTLEAAIAKVAGLPRTQWPEPIRHVREQALGNECREQVVALRVACAGVAKELEIAASTLAPRAALEAVVRSGARSVDEIVKNSGLLRWQAELLQDAVEKVHLRGAERSE
jgi:ribonuclease D